MPTVLSLFSGAGGMDLGFEGCFKVLKRSINPSVHPDWLDPNSRDEWPWLPPTGFITHFANDISETAKAQWSGYFNKGHIYHTESIVNLVKRHKAGEKIFPESDIVTGGFPCTDFSLSGKRKGVNSDKTHAGEKMGEDTPPIESRGMLYFWMKEVIEIVKPKAFVAENVDGLNSLPETLKKIQKDFGDVGYDVKIKTMYAPDYGIPQTRTRVIFVGLRKDVKFSGEFEYPEKTHSNYGEGLFGPELLPYVTCSEAFSGLKEPGESEDFSQNSLSGALYYGATKAGKTMQGQIEIPLEAPGPTIRAEHHGNIEFRRLSAEHGGRHTEELALGLKERRLTVRECARLQTFPDDYQFVTPEISTTKGYIGVGNAVPPLLAYHIAQKLKEIWPKDV